MANDNPHMIRFIDSLTKHVSQKDFDEYLSTHRLSKSASIDKKFVWAKSTCNFLMNKYEDDKIKCIRMDCACGPELGKGKKITEIYDKESDLFLFVEKVNKLNQGFQIEHDGESFYLIYPQCYCSCVKRIDQPLSKVWCYCTLGYTKRMFEYIFSRAVEVELLNSVKIGDDICKIRITVLD